MTKNPRGPQFRTQMMDKRYVALLRKHGRSTVEQLQSHTDETYITTLRRLVKLQKAGLIAGERVWRKWEFWAHENNPRT